MTGLDWLAQTARYWLAPKVAHSCNPNVGWEDPEEVASLGDFSAGDVNLQ